MKERERRAFRREVLQRAGDACERCGVLNQSVGARDAGGVFRAFADGPLRIVLGVSYVNGCPTALCQQCRTRTAREEREAFRRRVERRDWE